ncbi:MAG: PKD domain-containing protein, partial [Bacteroidales bacterium]|nr:PKD domain-containing protein [Bacteroidales bacterium]
MKKISFLLLFAFVSWQCSAQLCTDVYTPDPNCSYPPEVGGYCPSPLPDAVVGEKYSLLLTVIAPQTGENNGTQITVNYLNVVAVEGLPAGFKWCKSTDKFRYNEPGYIYLEGIPDTVGNFDLTIHVSVTVLGGLISISRTENSLTLHVIASQYPNVDCAANTTLAAVDTPIEFKDMTDNTAVSWQWTFENGIPATSTEQNPVVTWIEPGYHSVSLTATNAYGSKSIHKYNFIRITDRAGVLPPMAVFSSSLNNAIVKEEVEFYPNQEDSVVRWIDGTDNSVHQIFSYESEESAQSYY